MARRFNDYAGYLQRTYGKRVYRLGVDASFSCPNRDESGHGGCAYCDGTGSSAIYLRHSEQGFAHDSPYEEAIGKAGFSVQLPLEERLSLLVNQIERGKRFLVRRYKAEAFSLYFQSWTNTYDTLVNLKIIYDEALKHGPFVELILSTRPDCLSEEVLDLICSYQNKVQRIWVELGLQSAHDRTLSFLGRGHDRQSYIQSVNSLHLRGIGVCTHVMVGLPYENRHDRAETARLVQQVGSEAVKIHNLHICGGTRVEDWYSQGEVATSSVHRHVLQCCDFLRYLDKSVVIQRLMCETPSHRLVAPRFFPDKSQVLAELDRIMETNDWQQGDFT